MLQGHIYWNLHQPCVYIVIYSIFVKKNYAGENCFTTFLLLVYKI